MMAAPAASAVLADVLWCLGLGCLLGVARDGLSLVFGNGPVRCFFWDVLAFAMAAVLVFGFSTGVSASGVARWYMTGALLAGALAWRQAIQPAVHRFVRVVLHLLIWPLRAAEQHLLRPLGRRLAAVFRRVCPRRAHKKVRKKPKNGKKQLQKPSKILYN